MDRARMTEMGRFPAVFLVTLIVGLGACNHTLRPRVRAEPIHPDTDAMVVFRGERGEVEGTIDKMRLEVAGQTYERSGESLTVTAGPFATSSNERLTFRVVAVLAGGSRAESEEEWVFVANPRSEAATVLASTSASASDLIPPVTYEPASGSLDGWPKGLDEQTGPNLYRLDSDAVRKAAEQVLIEYSANEGSSTVIFPKTADALVEAVADYVEDHVDPELDGVIRILYRNHEPGDDDDFSEYEEANPATSDNPAVDEFVQPADLMIRRGGTVAKYQGDCEDEAILRAALLRRLGFQPWAVWHARSADYTVAGMTTSHEYNIILYEGAFRVVDGPVGILLDGPGVGEENKYRSKYGWNERHGPRMDVSTEEYLPSFADNYPGGKSDGRSWSHKVYFRMNSP
jgi:hypothetical protein